MTSFRYNGVYHKPKGSFYMEYELKYYYPVSSRSARNFGAPIVGCFFRSLEAPLLHRTWLCAPRRTESGPQSPRRARRACSNAASERLLAKGKIPGTRASTMTVPRVFIEKPLQLFCFAPPMRLDKKDANRHFGVRDRK